jgi:hypothetical protein
MMMAALINIRSRNSIALARISRTPLLAVYDPAQHAVPIDAALFPDT